MLGARTSPGEGPKAVFQPLRDCCQFPESNITEVKLRLLSFVVSFFLGGLLGLYLITGNAPRLVANGQATLPRQQCDGRHDFMIGSGIYDITGPAAGLGMMGYAQVGQKTGGIHFRLWSRAFVIECPCNNKRIVFVSADLLAIFQAVKLQVVAKLEAKYPGLYSKDNVIISAIHDHAGPGGYSHYKLYNLTIGGFDRQNFDTIVEGIYRSIVRADEDLAPGTIQIARGNLLKTSINRSPTSYLENPASERALYSGDPEDPEDTGDTDKQMTLLKLVHSDGTEIGEINWFAVHCTSMHNNNHLISGDNKGYASYLFERLKKTDYNSRHTFVAAFAQSNEGDVSPNIYGGQNGGGDDDFESTQMSGGKQYSKAVNLYDSADELLVGGIDYRHAFVKMDDVEITQSVGGVTRRTCPAAIGFSMLAGAADGPGIGWQGLACDKHKWLWFICKHLTTDCQAEKPIVVQTGLKKPHPWSPEILPVQLVTIGDLAIIAVPGEFTTMSGRRLVKTVLGKLGSAGVRYVVIAGLSNAYAGYVTTREEYAKQRYEGASTHFGPWTLAAYQQEFEKLAIALRDGTSVNPGPNPTDPRPTCIHVNNGEGKPPWKKFGDVHRDTEAAYQPGQTVEVTFWAGHPRNDLKIQDTFLRIERQDGPSWTTVALDRDWETRFIWKRSLSGSLARIEWAIPLGTPSGTYRIRHDGAYRSRGKTVPYFGLSKTFRVGLTGKPVK
jgi:neutral ceramidase